MALKWKSVKVAKTAKARLRAREATERLYRETTDNYKTLQALTGTRFLMLRPDKQEDRDLIKAVADLIIRVTVNGEKP